MNEPDTEVFMRRLAMRSRDGDALPDPVLIWWQAQMIERHEACRRAARPLMIAQWTSAIVAAVVVLVLTVLYWPGLRDTVALYGALPVMILAGIAVIWTGLAWRMVSGD
jgi:hypothetical protein